MGYGAAGERPVAANPETVDRCSPMTPSFAQRIQQQAVLAC